MYKTHRTEGSVVPVAVRHVSPKNPCCRKGRREGNIGEPLGERNQGERRPAGDSGARANDGPASKGRARASGAQQTIHEVWQAAAESGWAGDGAVGDSRALTTSAGHPAAPQPNEEGCPTRRGCGSPPAGDA